MSDTRLVALRDIHVGAKASDPRWSAVEAELGLSLPGSYKVLVERFGASSWREFLHVLSPFDERGWRRVAATLEADRALRRDFPHYYPLPLHPEPGGLLPWAVSDNGDTLYFVTAGPPDEWPTLVKGPRAPEFEVSFMAPAALVHAFASGRLHSLVLPGRVQDGEPGATPDPAGM
jgi:hypothetical protein